MGVKRLTTFVENYCARWELGKRVRGKLVIDGNCILHQLHTMEWSNGGQYRHFRVAVRRFYTALKDSGIEPIVVFDGVDEAQKLDVLRKRKQDWVDTIHSRITDHATRRNRCHGRILPPLTSEVYRMAFCGVGIQFYVADGEADIVIARLANHYSCPVLSMDSDFYVFRLVGGFIHLNHFYWESKPITTDIYHRDNFTNQLGLRDASLYCAIPAIVGNDFMEPCSPGFITQMLQSLHNRGKNEIKDICHYLSRFGSMEEFKAKGFGGRKLEERCRKAVEWYDSSDTLSIEELVESSELRHENGRRFPQWLVKLFHSGRLPSSVIGAAVSGLCIFRIIPDNFLRETSMLAGVRIRQQMYALLQVTEVVEVFRHKYSMVDIRVPSKALKEEFRGVSLHSIESLSPSQRQRLFYTILLVSDLKSIDLRLTAKYHDWKFVAAVTSFWARTTSPPEHLVRALLLCFMLCSWLNNSKFDHFIQFNWRVPIEFRQSQEWLDVLHCFMQWQVIYHTAWTLNALLMEPMAVFSPAFLYDGQLAMYLASSREIDRWLHEVDRELYTILEEIVFTARDLPSPASPAEPQWSSESESEDVFENEETSSDEDLTETTSATQTQELPTSLPEHTQNVVERQRTKEKSAPVKNLEAHSTFEHDIKHEDTTTRRHESEVVQPERQQRKDSATPAVSVTSSATADNTAGAVASSSSKTKAKRKRNRQRQKQVQTKTRDIVKQESGTSQMKELGRDKGGDAALCKQTVSRVEHLNSSCPIQPQPLITLDSVAPSAIPLTTTASTTSSFTKATSQQRDGKKVKQKSDVQPNRQESSISSTQSLSAAGTSKQTIRGGSNSILVPSTQKKTEAKEPDKSKGPGSQASLGECSGVAGAASNSPSSGPTKAKRKRKRQRQKITGTSSIGVENVKEVEKVTSGGNYTVRGKISLSGGDDNTLTTQVHPQDACNLQPRPRDTTASAASPIVVTPPTVTSTKTPSSSERVSKSRRNRWRRKKPQQGSGSVEGNTESAKDGCTTSTRTGATTEGYYREGVAIQEKATTSAVVTEPGVGRKSTKRHSSRSKGASIEQYPIDSSPHSHSTDTLPNLTPKPTQPPQQQSKQISKHTPVVNALSSPGGAPRSRLPTNPIVSQTSSGGKSTRMTKEQAFTKHTMTVRQQQTTQTLPAGKIHGNQTTARYTMNTQSSGGKSVMEDSGNANKK